jgi:hypothetical protein
MRSLAFLSILRGVLLLSQKFCRLKWFSHSLLNKSEADWLWQQKAHWRMANPHTCWTGIPEHDVDANARLNVQLSPIVDHRQAREEYLVLGKQQGTR